MAKGKSLRIGAGISVAIIILLIGFMGVFDVTAVSKTHVDTQSIEFSKRLHIIKKDDIRPKLSQLSLGRISSFLIIWRRLENLKRLKQYFYMTNIPTPLKRKIRTVWPAIRLKMDACLQNLCGLKMSAEKN